MTKLRIADDFSLPAEAVTQTFAVVAKRGAGKSYAASVMAEEMLKASQQVVVLDPVGSWFGLRSSSDGRSPGFPVVVLGGDDGDVPLEDGAGEVVAQALVEHRFPAIIDLSLFRKGQVRRFVTPFLETLYRLNREPLHLFVDEADDLAPQRPFGDEAQMVGAAEDVVKRGRRRGIGCTLITQRPADLAKQVLTQCEVLVALRLTHPRDVAAVREWVNVHADPDKAGEMIDSLPSLPVGTAWFWSPGWLDVFRRVRIRRRETFDSGATPKVGEAPRRPKKLAEVDIARLGERIASAARRARENDPRELRRRVADLERQLRERPAAPERVEVVPVLEGGHLERLEQGLRDLGRASGLAAELARSLSETAAEVSSALERAAAARPSPPPAPRERRPGPATPTASASPLGNSGKRRLLTALAQHPAGLTDTKLSLLTGISKSGGTWRTYLSELRGAGWVEGDRSLLRITPAGAEALGPYDPLPSGAALIDYWRRRLGDSGKRRIFDAVVAAHPGPLTPEAVSAATGIDLGGGTWRTYLSELRGLELVTGRGELRAADDLFN